MGAALTKDATIPKDFLRQCLCKFDADEVEVLQKIFRELASRSNSIGIDKETFLHYFNLPGLWGERLFKKFDLNGSDRVEWDEFLIGIAVCCRGTKGDKIRILYQVFDLNDDGVIQKSELTAMLSNFPGMTNRLSNSGIDNGDYHNENTAMSPHLMSDYDIHRFANHNPRFQPHFDAPLDQKEKGISKRIFHKETIQLDDLASSLSKISYRTDDNDFSESDSVQDTSHESKNLSETSHYQFPRYSDYSDDSLHASNSSALYSGSSDYKNEDKNDEYYSDSEYIGSSEPSSNCNNPLDGVQHNGIPVKRALQSMAHKGSANVAKSIVEEYNDRKKNEENNLHLDMVVEQILQDCKFKEDGCLTYEMFKAWMNRNESILEMFSECMHEEAWGLHGHAFHRTDTVENSNVEFSNSELYAKFSSFDKLDQEETLVKDINKRVLYRMFLVKSKFDPDLGASQQICSPELLTHMGNCEIPTAPVMEKTNADDIDITEEELFSCPSCGIPFLMCPRCFGRFPVLTLHLEDEVYMQCCVCANEGLPPFYNCWVCDWRFSDVSKLENTCNNLSQSVTPRQIVNSESITKDFGTNYRSFSKTEAGECLNSATPGISKVTKSGFMYKIGKHLHQWKQRYYVLMGNILYYYADAKSTRPKGCIFLEGCYLDTSEHDDFPGKFGFSICHGGLTFTKRGLYVDSKEQYFEWIDCLALAMRQQSLTQLYNVFEQLGQGKFSNVYRGVHKESGYEYAIKIIDKRKISLQERELLRSEIAVLRLLRHQHVIYLKDIIDMKDSLCIVMELVRGGELYDLVHDMRSLPESHAHRIITQLLHTLAYLHKCGIIHRDIKPENLLLTDKTERANIKLTDFGLSTLCGPNELLTQPCGTLAYVAPEVLTLSGYNQKADVWSIGVIMFLLIRGRLPFKIKKFNQQITDQYKLKFDDFWLNVSQSARDLITKMLEFDPNKRISVFEALDHIWVTNFVAVQHELHANSAYNEDNMDVIMSLRNTTDSTFVLPHTDATLNEFKALNESQNSTLPTVQE
ncbi:bifunctional EF-hand domain/Pleckstrin homology domain/Protein kinase domain/Protein kinase-like domain superfamily/EF-Hand 1 [Babesia duncani]|uniref:Bifunctional EF-hand domain/Pleckstrin homology domain/Protein kinase domain/Protein kinase-like domain superfamily/EF-Hand 1 n=1 Tax=Babesia duncani TaxID=323732 RepID=A0AAD9UQZ6_9APIC|nr:bifunctional EF-hand domain/Pleckstrin homology domain/Protein kinase domain/Protein kinase-like domain superfamily/EF-Hand 1 [Babesia duncani]